MNFKNFFIKNKEIFQLAYGIVLLVIIPSLIVFNTIFILNRYNKSIDNALLHQSLNISRSIYSLIQEDLGDDAVLQEKVEKIMMRNSAVEEILILKPEGDDFKVAAGSDKGKINKIYTSTFYKRAWISPDNDGIATDSTNLMGVLDMDEFNNNNTDERYWFSALPMRGSDDKKQAVLSVKVSSEIIDTITDENRSSSLYLLAFTILITILFLSIAIRLWDYVLLYKKIKEVDQMKDEFISIASHELRTPVTSIRGYTSMVLDGTFGEINDKVKSNLSMVQASSDRLARLVEDLLNVSRIEQGRLKIESKPAEAGAIIRDTVAELKVQADEKKIALNYSPHADKLPLINIDLERFKQVLINIIGNAVKYTQKGEVSVFTDVKDNGKILEIKIKDTGIGMSAKDRERLFEKFYRVQSEATKNIIGTGLGLWITKKIVELMKGKIMVDSIEGVGTQVALHFPIAK